jgi:hypothetical protein
MHWKGEMVPSNPVKSNAVNLQKKTVFYRVGFPAYHLFNFHKR